MGTVEIRRAVESDAATIADVHVRSWKAAYAGLVPADYLAGLSADDRVPVWRQVLFETDWPAKGGLVLVEGGAVVGFAWVCPSRDADALADMGELGAIYLLPEAWGRGGGRLLMEEAFRRLRDARFRAATLWVLRANDRARAFYEAGGWSADGAERTEERPGVSLDEIRFRRSL